jgi:hypothetical protein
MDEKYNNYMVGKIFLGINRENGRHRSTEECEYVDYDDIIITTLEATYTIYGWIEWNRGFFKMYIPQYYTDIAPQYKEWKIKNFYLSEETSEQSTDPDGNFLFLEGSALNESDNPYSPSLQKLSIFHLVLEKDNIEFIMKFSAEEYQNGYYDSAIEISTDQTLEQRLMKGFPH